MIAFLDYFQRVYIINLPSRKDRKHEMQAQLEKIGLTLEHPQIELFSAIRPDSAGDFPSIGARGCFMSHLGILKDAQKRGLATILILEDDLDFAQDFQIRMPKILHELTQSTWGIFYGGYEFISLNTPINSGIIIPPYSLPVRTTHFVGFQQPTIALLIDYLEKMLSRPGGDPEGGPMHVDGAYSWFRKQHPDVLTLLAAPELGHRWPGVRFLASEFRRFKRV
jgi:glycosyl transferase, family 25